MLDSEVPQPDLTVEFDSGGYETGTTMSSVAQWSSAYKHLSTFRLRGLLGSAHDYDINGAMALRTSFAQENPLMWSWCGVAGVLEHKVRAGTEDYQWSRNEGLDTCGRD